MKDSQIEKRINEEAKRQDRVVNLIASENHVSQDVLVALGSVLTNKYAEGYPGKRYYGGNEIVDSVERLCRERALHAFGLSDRTWHVNVQPLSGSPANMAVYLALLGTDKQKKIMGLRLDQGGHLTHGFPVSATGQFWTQVPYELDPETEQLDYEALKKKAKKERPDVVVAGFTAYPRKVSFQKFREIADAAGAYLHIDMSHLGGLVAGGQHPSPFRYADTVMTTVHKTLRGPRAGLIFARRDKRTLPQAIDKAVFPGVQGGPHINQIAATAVALKEASTKTFAKYAKQVTTNARVLADELTKRGWRIVSGGTDTHLLLVDTWMDGSGISGKEAQQRLEQNDIIVNKNTIPNETRRPTDPSGIRIGTAAETTKGAKEKDMKKIAEQIDSILSS